MVQKRVPAKKTDSAGATLEAGDLVRIIEIPAWLTHDLPPQEADLVLAELNAVRRIARFDGYGYAWFGDESGEWFCLLPTNLLRIADA
jgi:hypothetical protein